MKIHLTQEDIDKALEAKEWKDPPSSSCPVYQAMARVFPTFSKVIRVGFGSIEIGYSDFSFKEMAIVLAFDRGDIVEPTTFSIRRASSDVG